MSEPSRLVEQSGSALERALLEVGSSYRSSEAARAKTLSALGLAGSATLLAGASQAVPLGALAKATWGKLLAAVSLVGVAAGVPVGYFAWQRHHAAAQGRTAGVVATAPVAEIPPEIPTATATGIAPATGGAPRLAMATGQPAEAAPPDSAPLRGHRAVMRTAPTVTLAHELSSIDAARMMLASGDAGGALARLDGYERAYPHGRLAVEAEVLRIDALDASGRGDAARARAESFLRHHPHSVLAARVRARLGD